MHCDKGRGSIKIRKQFFPEGTDSLGCCQIMIKIKVCISALAVTGICDSTCGYSSVGCKIYPAAIAVVPAGTFSGVLNGRKIFWKEFFYQKAQDSHNLSLRRGGFCQRANLCIK